MNKWKCGICNSEFDNYQAQGFNGIIYCPLCYFKELYKREQNNWNELEEFVKQLQIFKGINQQGFNYGVAQEVLDKMNEIKDKNNDKSIE